MKKRSKAYWEKRAADRMVDYMADAERTSNTLGKAYYSVGRYLSDEAAKILKSFTDTFGLSESEARQLIGTTPEKSITEKLKKALPKIADKDKRRQAEAMISSPAYSYRIKRLENLGNNVRKQCSQLYNTEVLADDSFFRGLCDDAYKHCIFDMQKGMGVSSAFDIMPTSRINRILSTKWSGEHFSARVWGNTNALADGLQSDLLVGIMSGKSEKKMAEDIMNRCAVGAFEARRLVRTEACYIANQAELDGYRQTGIESYEFSAVLDNRTSKLCDNVDGLDGKIFKISEAVPGKNLPPMHPFCRSTTLPILPSEEELDREIAELSDEIGADVDFEEWKENLQETGDGRLVYRTKAVDKSRESGIIDIEVDELVPCLKDNTTGEILATEVRTLSKSEYSHYTASNGWSIDWGNIPDSEEVLGVYLSNDTEPQGLIAIRKEKDGIYLSYASTAPHNNKQLNKGNQRYAGVGGHLFAAAIEESLKAGNATGCVYGYAVNEDVLKHYINTFGAVHLPIVHEYQFIIDGEAAQKMLEKYNFERR